MKMNQKILLFMLALLFIIAPKSDARTGIRVGSYTDWDELYIGAELVRPMNDRIQMVPNLEYVLIEHGSLLVINMDFHYDLNTRTNLPVWAGGGAGLHFLDAEHGDSDSDLGLNLLAGVGFPMRNNMLPYIQGKLIFSGYEDFVITFGLRF